MQTFRDKAIVLARTNYGEADRILTFLTATNGAVQAIAKGVRKSKSKLAGGIELFAVNDVTFVGAKELKTVTSARMAQPFSNIVKDLDRTMFGYELLKYFKSVSDANDEQQFATLMSSLDALNDASVSLDRLQLWLDCQLLAADGRMPNLSKDQNGDDLSEENTYTFDTDHMRFVSKPGGRFDANHIKLLRLCFAAQTPKIINQVTDQKGLFTEVTRLVQAIKTS